jgi:hypothetical protein
MQMEQNLKNRLSEKFKNNFKITGGNNYETSKC